MKTNKILSKKIKLIKYYIERSIKVLLFVALLSNTAFFAKTNLSFRRVQIAQIVEAEKTNDGSFALTATTQIGEIKLTSESKDFPAGKPLDLKVEKNKSDGLVGIGQTAVGFWQNTVDIFADTPKNTLEIKIVNSLGNVVDTSTIEYSQTNNGITISTDNFKPGAYTMEILEVKTGNTFKQDFTWGVLAINTNKSIYIPGEDVKFSIAVLDNYGRMVCDAKLTLEINGASPETRSFSTNEKTIIVNPECEKKEYTLLPDFSASLENVKSGTYSLTLTAVTSNGTFSIDDSFEVRNKIDFEVERITATRLYPINEYPVVIKIKANQDYRGIVEEKTSESLMIYHTDSNELFNKFGIRENLETGLVKKLPGILEENRKSIKWEVNWKKGEYYTLAYYFKPPEASPDFFTLGKLEIGDFQEARFWQLANDDIGTNLVVAWPSTAGTIPSGWQRVTALDSTYVRGVATAATNPGSTGGAATHSHTTPSHSHTISHTHATATSGNATGSVTAGTTSNLDLIGTTHSHTTGAVSATTDPSSSETPTSGSTSNDPGYLSVIWIEPITTATGIPNGALALYNDTSLPTNWSIYANSVDRFLKGAAALGDGGGTGGSATHSHTGEGSHTHTSSHTHPNGTSGASAGTNNSYAAGTIASGDSHTHEYTVASGNFGASNAQTLTTSSDNLEPPYHEQAIIQNGTGSNSLPSGIIAIWRGTIATIPSGWMICDGNNGTPNLLGDFIRGATSTERDTGGSTSHTHTGSNHTHTWASTVHTHVVTFTSPPSVRRGTTGTTATWASATHTHTATSGAAGTVTVGTAAPNLDSATHTPPYEEVAYIRYLPSDIYTGYAYTDDTEGTALESVSVCLAVNGVHNAADCDTTDASGNFSIMVTADTSANDELAFFIDGGTTFGNTVTVATGSDISTLRIYQNHVIVRHDQGSSIAISQMEQYDNTSNSTDMLFDATDSASDTLTVEDGNEFYIPSGVTFAPAGNLDNGSGSGIDDIKIVGTYTAASGQSILVSGSWANSGTFTSSTSTVTFDAPGATTETINSTGATTDDFYNVIFNDGGGGATFQLSSVFDVNGALTITGGTLDTNGQNITLAGNFDNDDTLTMTSGTLTMDGTSGTITMDTDGTGTDAIFNLIFSDGGGPATFQLTTAADINGTLTITGGTFDANSNNINIAGSWANNDTFTSGTQTTTFDGTSGTISIDATGTGTSSFSTLTINDNNGSATFQLTSALDVNGSFNLTDGVLQQNGANNITTAGAVTIGSGATYTKGSGIWTFDGTGDSNYTDGTGTQNIGDVTIDAESATRTVSLQSATVIDNLTIAADGILAMGTQNVTIGNTNDASHGDINIATGGSTSQTSGTVTILSNSGTTQWNGAGTLTAFNLTIGNGTNTFTIDNETSDLPLDLGGTFTITANATLSASSTATFDIAGSWSDSGTFTPNSSSVKLNATSGTPTITTTGSSFNNLEIDDTNNNVTFTLSDALDVNANLTITGGTLNTGTNYQINVGGIFTNNDIFTANSGTVVMDGTSASIAGTSNTSFYDLTINPISAGTVTLSSSDPTVTNTLNVATGDVLSLSSGRTLTHSGTTLTLDGTVSGAGTYIYSGGGTLPTGGTLSTPVRFDATNNAQTVVNRTYTGNVEFYSNSSSADRTFALGTAGSQTITFGANVTLNAAGASTITVSGASNNPTVNITGNLDSTSGSGVENITTGSGTWTVTGNVDLTDVGTFTSTGNTFQMNGTGVTLTSAGESFNNYAVTGGSVSNVDSMDVNGTFSVTSGGFTHGAGADIDIDIAGNFTLSSGTTWTENTTDTSDVIFSGDLNYADNTATIQSIGNVIIGASPDTTNLTTDFAANSLSVTALNFFNTCQYEVDIGNGGITIGGTFDASATGNAGSVSPCNAGSDTDESTINDAQSFTLSSGGVLVADASTIIMDDPSGTDDFITVGTGNPYILTIQTGGATIEVEDPLTVTNNLTITSGTLDVVTGENNQINVGGNWTNDATFVERSGKVVLDGTTSVTLDSNCTDVSACTNENFYDLEINKTAAGASDDNVTLSNFGVRVTNTLTITDGELIQGTFNVRAEGTSSVSIASGGTWTNTSTGDLTLGGTFTNAGTATFQGTTSACGETDAIAIASTTTDDRNWAGAGTFNINDITCSDMSSTPTITAYSSTNSGSSCTSNWTFVSCPQSFSGNVYNFGTSSPLTECDADTGTYELRLRSSSTTYSASCSNADGSYSFSDVIVPSAGDAMVAWIEGLATDGALVVRYDGSGDSTSNIFYDDAVTVTSDDTNPVDILDMNTYDYGDDNDIPYTATDATPDTLVVNSGIELYITLKSGVAADSTVFDPGGEVSTGTSNTEADLHIAANTTAYLDTPNNNVGGDIEVDDSATLYINGSTIIYGGDITTSGTGATVTRDSGDPTITMAATGTIGGGTSPTFNFYELRIAVSGITTTISNDVNLGDDLIVQAGATLNANGSITVFGNFTNQTTGIINVTSGTPTVTMTGSNPTLGGGSGNITLYNVVVNAAVGTSTVTFSGSGTNTFGGSLTITAGDTFVQNSALTITGDIAANGTLTVGANLNIDGGDLTTGASGAVGYTGTPTVDIDGTGTLGGNSITTDFYNLDLGDGTSDTTTLGSGVTIDNSLTVDTSQEFDMSTFNVTVGSTSVTGSGDITANGTFSQSSNGTLTILSSSGGEASLTGNGFTVYNLTIGDGSTSMTFDQNTNDAAILIANDLSILANATFSASNIASIMIRGSYSNSGTFTANSGLVNFVSDDAGQTLSGNMTGASSFYNIEFEDNGGGGTWSFGANSATIANLFNIVSGAITAPSTTLTIGGNFTNNGSFIHNSGTVVFNNAVNVSTLTYSAPTTFNNFTVATAGKQMQFDNDAQTNIAGLFSIQGTNCTTGRVFLDSDVDDSAWEIYVSGTYDIDYADVEDSTAITTALTAENSTADNNSNTNWTVNGGSCGSVNLHQNNIRGDTRVRGGVRILYDWINNCKMAYSAEKWILS